MKIGLAKIGQKVTFNRSSDECNRSNTNGNVGTYLLFKNLVEQSKEHIFYMLTDSDCAGKFNNLIDAKFMDFNNLNLDAIIVMAGLMERESNYKFINFLNNFKKKYLLLSDDPRCLLSVSNDIRLTSYPASIITQFSRQYSFKGLSYVTRYIPLEMVYATEQKVYDKEYDITILANEAGDYDRIGILEKLIKNLQIPVYGRIKQTSLKKYMGEIKFEEAQNILSKSKYTLLIPIEKNCVTSKYVEAICNGCYPIFYKDYNTKLINNYNFTVIHNKIELLNVLNSNIYIDIYNIYNNIIKQYVNTNKLTKQIMECLL